MCWRNCFLSLVARWAGLAPAVTVAAGAASLTTLVSFNGTNGANPAAGLVLGANGNFYGTTEQGGPLTNGTVFVLSPAGALSNWFLLDPTTGTQPLSGLVRGTNGDYYGTASQWGSDDNGTVIAVSPLGVASDLVSFDPDDFTSEGAYPAAGLVLGSDGNLYGTTVYGGDYGQGVVFVATPSGGMYTLHSFSGTDGANPYGALVQGQDGNFYGTTSAGGAYGNGTVFVMSPSGAFTNLVFFDGTNGANPKAALIQASDGNFYGITSAGGGTNGVGTVFRMTPTGQLAVLALFNGLNGDTPLAGLVQGLDGAFYGTTLSGGQAGNGTVFELTPDGTLVSLWAFDGLANGGTLRGDVIFGPDGALYGTTYYGGASGIGVNGYGTVFRLASPPVILTQPGSQTNLAGANVSFAVSAAVLGPFAYQWQLNGAPIPGATGPTLALNNVTVNDSGTYTVVVTNQFGSVVSSNAVLTVVRLNAMVNITSPAPGAVITNSVLTIVGTASDSLPLAGVFGQLNGSSWRLAATTDGWTNWSQEVTLPNGLNTLSVYCLDSAGGVSATNTEQITYAPLGPFVSQSGIYHGLFYATNGVALDSAGEFTLSTRRQRAFSGHLQFAAARYSFAGNFDTNGAGQATISPFATRQMTVTLQVDRVPGSDRIYGTVANGIWTAELAGDLAGFNGREKIATQAGQYTLVIAGISQPAAVPIGTGFGIVKINPAGKIKLAGVLADGGEFSRAETLSKDGSWPLFVPLYRGHGLLMGWVTNQPLAGLTGALSWIKPRSHGKYYTNGFELVTTLLGSRYTPPTMGGNPLGFTNGTVVFSGGNLALSVTNSIAIDGLRGIGQSNKLSMVFNASTGSFRGRFASPFSPQLQTLPIEGVVLQGFNSAYGFFLGRNQSGQVIMAP